MIGVIDGLIPLEMVIILITAVIHLVPDMTRITHLVHIHLIGATITTDNHIKVTTTIKTEVKEDTRITMTRDETMVVITNRTIKDLDNNIDKTIIATITVVQDIEETARDPTSEDTTTTIKVNP